MIDIRTGQHEVNTFGPTRGIKVPNRKRALCYRRTKDVAEKHALRRDVIGVAAVAGDEGIVFLSKHGRAHSEFRRHYIHWLKPCGNR